AEHVLHLEGEESLVEGDEPGVVDDGAGSVLDRDDLAREIGLLRSLARHRERAQEGHGRPSSRRMEPTPELPSLLPAILLPAILRVQRLQTGAREWPTGQKRSHGCDLDALRDPRSRGKPSAPLKGSTASRD